MPRTPDPAVDEAITAATLKLLERSGFAAMSIEAVAKQAGVGKPAIYRRFAGKAELVAHAIDSQLPALEPPDTGEARKDLLGAMEGGFPTDAPAYTGLIGGLLAEQNRHPELIEAFRRSVLGPRRAIVRGLIERGQKRGEIRSDIDATAALDLLAGPLLARAFAGEDTGKRWRRAAFETWWMLIEERGTSDD